MLRPVITFLTDFGPDSAAAICRGVMLGISRDAQIIDISHSVRKLLDPRRRLAAVDLACRTCRSGSTSPSSTRAWARRAGRSASGPARGDIFDRAGQRPARPGRRAPRRHRRGPRPREPLTSCCPRTTSTFHGRDIFAPVAAHLANGVAFEEVGPAVDAASIVRLAFPSRRSVTASSTRPSSTSTASATFAFAGEPADLEAALGPLASGARLTAEFARHDGRAAIHEADDLGSARSVTVEQGRPLLYEDSVRPPRAGRQPGPASLPASASRSTARSAIRPA